jgi:c-di-GMP-binding flagellar brake protein YcgR
MLRLAADDLRVNLPALVIRCDDEGDRSVVGVTFTDLDRETRADLSRFVFGQARQRAAARAADEHAG